MCQVSGIECEVLTVSAELEEQTSVRETYTLVCCLLL